MNKKLLLTITLLTGTAGLSAAQTPPVTSKELAQAGVFIGVAAAGSYALYKGAQWIKSKYQDYQEYKEAQKKYAKGYHAVYDDGKFIFWVNGQQIVKITNDNDTLSCYLQGKNVATLSQAQIQYVRTVIELAINGPIKTGVDLALGMVRKALNEETQGQQLALTNSIFS